MFFISTSDNTQDLYAKSITEPDAFWAEQAQTLRWRRPFDQVSHINNNKGLVSWFLGGQLNVSGLHTAVLVNFQKIVLIATRFHKETKQLSFGRLTAERV